jgi:hypothetical protein
MTSCPNSGRVRDLNKIQSEAKTRPLSFPRAATSSNF